MTTTRSHKHSKTSRHKLLIGFGCIIIAGLLLSLASPYIIRANRGVIRSEISRIQALDVGMQEREFIMLVRATGADQEVSRALADWYLKQKNYLKAGEALLAANPSLKVEAAQVFASIYDFQRVLTILTPLTQQSNESVALLAQARMNTGNFTHECKDTARLNQAGLGKNLVQACEILMNQQPSTEQIYSLVTLGAPLQAKHMLDQRSIKSQSDYLVLARISARQGDTQATHEYIRRGLASTPYDRMFITSSIEILQTLQKGDQSLLDSLKKQLEILPSQ